MCRVSSLKHGFARSPGFTLIELLVALVLLGLVFLLLFSGLQFGTKVWSAGEEEVADNSQVLAVQGLLRRLLGEARPIMVEAEKNAPRRVLFVGTENSLRFVAPMPTYLGMGGFYEVAIYLAEGDRFGRRLVMSWHLLRPSGASLQVSEEQRTLIEGVTELNFYYFGYRGQKEPPQWYNNWQNLQSLPDLIRMRLTHSGGPWPDLVVAPMVRSVDLIVPEAN